ncbi:zinc finger protein 287 isoform X2 [Amyelois transitella]|uniref:zinc finger protein 287 isoform X2 n=1 Tax=Amyelois transitella TaxID=680683 RepID=UPI00298F46F8|nr:zinc finger protein 287 isoform X2 [Amyelois transitella]
METNADTPYKLLCTACLCFGRSLQPLRAGKLNQCYLDIIKEIPLYNTPIQCPSVCLECSALLRKVVSFREQVQDSYRILQAYTSETLTECLLTDVTRPPKLRTHILESIDIMPMNHVTDIAVHKEASMKSELKNEFHDPEIEIDKSKSRESSAIERDRKSNEATKVCASAAGGDYYVVCVKDELKDENKEFHQEIGQDYPQSDGSISDQEADFKECNIDEQMEAFLTDIKKEKGKVKKRKVKRKKENVKTSKDSTVATSKIHTIELTYEEMLAERARDSAKESYLKAEFKCMTCLVGFNYKASYNSHMAAKHSPSIGNYSCPICNTVLPTLESFQTHYRRHMRRYECSMCQRRTLDLKVMEQHYYSTHRISLKQYPCSECAHVSNSIDLHRYHKDTHKARVQCPDCDKSFIHRAGLMNHRLAVHELNNKFPCTICDKVFRWKTSLKRHLEKHDTRALDKTASNVARCETCKINFASECSYKRHMKNSLKHVTQDQLRYVCDHCDRRFADKTKLRDHIEEKHLHRTYQCHICLKPSKNRVGLDQHIRNVHKGRPNDKMCHHCGKGFPTKVQLESHIRTHTGERPFICEFCPTMFSQQSNLYKHNRQVHLNMKSKRYPMCKKRKDEQTPEAAPETYRHVLRKRKEEQPPDVTNEYRPGMSVFGHYVDERYCPV